MRKIGHILLGIADETTHQVVAVTLLERGYSVLCARTSEEVMMHMQTSLIYCLIITSSMARQKGDADNSIIIDRFAETPTIVLMQKKDMPWFAKIYPVSYTHLTLPTNREV